MKVKIQYINDFGLGVFQHGAHRAFVPYTLTGEEVTVSNIKKQGGGFFAKLVTINKKSKLRQSPPCPYYTRCGGCGLQHMDDTTYKDFKTNLVKGSVEKH